MKALSFFLTLFLWASMLFAQTDPKVYVKGTTASSIYDGTSFYNLEPSDATYSNEYSYLPSVEFDPNSTVPSNATQTYVWTIEGGTMVSNSNTNQQINTKWNNTKNYDNLLNPSKTIMKAYIVRP